MELHPLPARAEQALRARHVPGQMLAAVCLMVACLDDTCRSTADDLVDPYDDQRSRGFTRWVRTSNLVGEIFKGERPRELADLELDRSDNAVQLGYGDWRLSFYAARNGVSHPDLTGNSKTKRTIVSDMQQQIEGLSDPERPLRLMLAYNADEEGLVEARVGVLADEKHYGWFTDVFRRDAMPARTSGQQDATVPSYDEQPVPTLPSIRRRRRSDERHSE